MALLKKLPFYAFAIIGGLLSGFDIAISGGILTQAAFLNLFFPKIYNERSMVTLENTTFCSYFNKKLMYIASIPHALGSLSGFFTEGLQSMFGPKVILVVSSVVVIAGGVISIVVVEFAWFLSGRIIVGLGMAFLRQVIPKYLGEAPPREVRDNLDICYDLCSTLGVLLGTLFIASGLGNTDIQQWRNISFPLMSLASLLLFLILFRIPQSPKYLMFRNERQKASQTLEKILDPNQIQQELDSLDNEVRELRGVNPVRELFRRSSLPHLLIHVSSFIFRSMMGSSTLLFFLPVFLVGTGLEKNPSLYAPLCTSLTSLVVAVISVLLIKHTDFRRRASITVGCGIVITAQIALGILFLTYVKPRNDIHQLTKIIFIFLMCAFVMGSTFVANPMGWLSQSYPRTAWSVGSIFSRNLNPTWDFLLSILLLSLLCSIRGWTFIFFGIVSVLMLLFVRYFLPADHPDVAIDAAWRDHWFWSRFVHD